MTEEYDPLFKKHFGKAEVVANGYVYPADIVYFHKTQDKYEVRIVLPNGHAYLMTVPANMVREPRAYAVAYDQKVVSPEFMQPVEKKKKKSIGFPNPTFKINDCVIYTDKIGVKRSGFIVGWTYERVGDFFSYKYSVRIPVTGDEGEVICHSVMTNVVEQHLENANTPVEVKPEAKFKVGDNVFWLSRLGTRKRKATIRSFSYDSAANEWTYGIDIPVVNDGMNMGVSGFSSISEKLLEKNVEEKPKFTPGDRVAFTKKSTNYGSFAKIVRASTAFPKFWELEIEPDGKEMSTHQDFLELAPKKELMFKKGDVVIITDPESPFESQKAVVSHIAHNVLQTEKANPSWIVRVYGRSRDSIYSQSMLKLAADNENDEKIEEPDNEEIGEPITDPYQAIVDEAREKLEPFLEAVGQIEGNVDFKKIGTGIGKVVEFFGGLANFDPMGNEDKDKDKDKDNSKKKNKGKK